MASAARGILPASTRLPTTVSASPKTAHVLPLGLSAGGSGGVCDSAASHPLANAGWKYPSSTRWLASSCDSSMQRKGAEEPS